MKKTYIQPEILAIELQQCQVIAASDAKATGTAGLDEGGSSDGLQAGEDRVKGSTNVWDEEW